MTTYNLIQNFGRTYLAPLMLGATILMGGCEKEESFHVEPDTIHSLQVVQAQRERKLAGLVDGYRQSVDEAHTLFNEALRDGRLTATEQKSIYNALGRSKERKSKAILYANNLGTSIESKVKNNSADRLYELLEENLTGQDWGAPELELSLRKENLAVYVERIPTEKDSRGIPLIGLGIVILLGLLGKKSLTGDWHR